MLSIIPLLTAVLFSALYPLCFWLSWKDPLKNNFHKFHIGLPNFIGGVAVVALFFMNVPLFIKIAAIGWKVVFFSVSNFYWKKGRVVNPKIISIPCLMGLFVFAFLEFEWVLNPLVLHKLMPASLIMPALAVSILGGSVFILALFSMNLGHWYLNVHGLPMHHLRRAVAAFAITLALRLLWDIGAMVTAKVYAQDAWVSLWSFSSHLDGFFVWVAVGFGTIFPLIALYFVDGTLKVKSTQSATGILYVIVSSVLIGDMAYKYYLIRYGVVL